MASKIDVTMPAYGAPTTESVRSNFATAAAEISALQAAVGGVPPALTVASGPAAVVPAGTVRVYVTTPAAVTITLPPNDCLVVDRSGNRANPIIVQPPAGGATINGLASYNLVNPWQAADFLFDGANYAVIG